VAHIQELKNATKKELNGTQLIVFFLQRWIQPLQARVSKLWTYSSLTDHSRVSQKDPELKDLEKGVRSLTTLISRKGLDHSYLSSSSFRCHTSLARGTNFVS
jgi:hypothetical protein